MAARKKTKDCDEPSCLHVSKPRVVASAPTLNAIAPDDDDGSALLVEGRYIVGAESLGLDASRAVLTDCLLERCDLASAIFRRARLNRVAFVDCRMVGSDFGDEARLEDVTFEGCLLDMASFDSASLTRVVFSRSRMPGASFGLARLERVAFPDSDLSRCDFAGALAPGGTASIDLRSATLAAVSFDARLLRAIAIRPEDAVGIARALGMAVTDGAAQASCKHHDHR